MSVFMKIIVLIMMIIGLVGVFSGDITIIGFIAATYGGAFLYLLDNYLRKLIEKL